MSELFDRPPIAGAPISIVLPAFNVEAVVTDVVRAWLIYLGTLNRDCEIILVNDGSSDRTQQLAEQLATADPRLVVLAHPAPGGIGAALRTGLAAARHPLVGYAACSPAYEPADLSRLLEFMDQVDLASGMREWEGPKPPASWRQWAARGLVHWIFGVRLKDPDCPFKLFRRSIFSRIPIQSDGSFVHAEILAKANFLGCLIAEAPIRYRPQAEPQGGHVEPRPERAEALQVFRSPDFGPAELPAPGSSTDSQAIP
jgi:glycosyltransferase involved in cell wall biosynthesis